MHLKLIASIYRMRAISSTNFGEHGRNFMVNMNVKCMNHCTPDFLASVHSVLNMCTISFFFANIYEQAVPGTFFLEVVGHFLAVLWNMVLWS